MTTEELKVIAELVDEAIANGTLTSLIQSFLMAMGLAVAAMAVFFILQAIGLYTINRRLGNKGAALAFIPGFSGYALGACADGLKKRKPSNYCIHMLMLELFYVIASVVYYVYVAGRFLWLYGALVNGHPLDTLSLLEITWSFEGADTLFLISYGAVYFLSYVVSFVSLLCYMRILQLFRSRSGFFLLLASIFVPQVMSIYLFSVRHKELYPKVPVFHMPGMENESDISEDDPYSQSEPYGDPDDEYEEDVNGRTDGPDEDGDGVAEENDGNISENDDDDPKNGSES